jgi:hypothetical protein
MLEYQGQLRVLGCDRAITDCGFLNFDIAGSNAKASKWRVAIFGKALLALKSSST